MEKLSSEASIELFVKYSGDIYPDEIYKLMLYDSDQYPITKLIPTIKELPQNVPHETKQKIMHTLKGHRKQIQALSLHDLFR